MTAPTFGITINEVSSGALPAQVGDFSTLGMIVTAPDADATAFPLNTPVLVNSNDTALVDKLGETGSVAGQFDLVNDHSGRWSTNVIVVRVDAGVDDDATMANIIAAMDHVEGAAEIVGVSPRLICIPGYTHQQESSNVANPVVAALGGTLDRLEAIAFVTGPTASYQAWLDWRETIAHARIAPIAVGVKAGSPAVTYDAAPAIAAMWAQEDNKNGGRPFRSAANRPMNIVAPGRDIRFNIIDGAVEGQMILAQNGHIVVRGAAGAIGAISEAGFIYIGTETCSTDPIYQFVNVRRGRDYIHDAYLRTLRTFLGRRVVNQGTVEDVKATISNFLASLQATGDILGYEVSFDRNLNPVAQLAQGRITVTAAAEEAPVLVHITIDSERLPSAFDDLASALQ